MFLAGLAFHQMNFHYLALSSPSINGDYYANFSENWESKKRIKRLPCLLKQAYRFYLLHEGKIFLLFFKKADK